MQWSITSPQEKERLFHTELVKSGVEYHTAAKAARILVSWQSDELLTSEEVQMLKDVCRQWLDQRKRLDRIHSAITSMISTQANSDRVS